LAWPHRRSDWPGKFSPIIPVYTEIIKKLTEHETVFILVDPSLSPARIRKHLADAHVNTNAVELVICGTDRSWVRDSGPIFVQDNNSAIFAIDWHFNAWAKYADWLLDDRVPQTVAEYVQVPRLVPQLRGWRVVLEGGSIDVNGAGALLTTEECLLSRVQERNPPLDRADYEQLFHDYLGIRQVLWLDRGIVGDDTHGHVDDLARFINHDTIVAVREQDTQDENYHLLEENWDRLGGFTTPEGRAYQRIALPMPRPIVYSSQRLPASYANFYIANNIVLVPTFNDPADRQALGILAELFPDRTVCGIHCGDLVLGLGTLHCMTQQQPR
jgi:agmatine deiminase